MPVRMTDFSITEEAFDTAPQSDPRQGQPGDAGAERRRSRLRSQGRRSLHEPISSRRSGSRPGIRAAASARSASEGFHDRSVSGADASWASLPCRSFPPNEPLQRRRDSRRSRRPTGETIVYLRRRFVPQPERFALLREHTVTAGRPAGQRRRAVPRRSGAVLAHLRRQPRAAAGRAHRRRSAGGCASPCRKACQGGVANELRASI